jgi:hypothetical protein
MAGALYLPNADRTSRWFLDDFPNQFVMPRIDKTLLHSTETPKTSGCPGYSGGATAPQITINPWSGHRKIWHHFPINRAGRALGNPSSTPVSENKDNVFQVEIIGYSDPALGRQYGCYLPEMSDADLDYLADAIAFVHKEWPHPTTLPSTWPLYKVSSWPAMDAAHMTSEAYDRFSGILAHLHAPLPSTHGDVALKIQTLKAKVDARLAPPPPTDWSDVATRAEIQMAMREVLYERETARRLFTGHTVMTDPVSGARVAPSSVIEKGAAASVDNKEEIAELQKAVAALAALIQAATPEVPTP